MDTNKVKKLKQNILKKKKNLKENVIIAAQKGEQMVLMINFQIFRPQYLQSGMSRSVRQTSIVDGTAADFEDLGVENVVQAEDLTGGALEDDVLISGSLSNS